MNTTVGAGMTGLNLTTGSGSQNWYFTRFVSSPIFDSTVSANTWTYNFAAWQIQSTANFPVTSSNKPVRVNVYVWRPSTSTKVGTILDGNTASTVDEGPSSGTRGHHVTFSGSSVAGVQGFDVIVMEIWFIINGTAGRNCTFYYDGTTVNTTDNATVSNHASFLETPQNLNLVGGTLFERSASGNFTIAASPVRVKKVIRSVSNNLTINAVVARVRRFVRTASNNVTSSASPVRMKKAIRTVSGNTVQLDASPVRLRLVPKQLDVTFSINDFVIRFLFVPRTVSNVVTIIANVTSVKFYDALLSESFSVDTVVQTMKRAIRTINQTVEIVADVTRFGSIFRSISDSFTIVTDAVNEKLFVRNISDSLSIDATLSRFISASRTINVNLTLVGELVAGRVFSRSIFETLTIDAVVARFYRAIRPISQLFTIVADAVGARGREKTVEESFEIEDSVVRQRTVPRIITQSITIMTSIFQKMCRAYPDE